MNVQLNSIISKLKQIKEEQLSLTRGNVKFSEQIARRQKIITLKELLKNMQGSHQDEIVILDALNLIKNNLKLENFMLSVPKGVSIIEPEHLKQSQLSNGFKTETRFYIAPHFQTYDHLSLSCVVALTPNYYIQPYHEHTLTDEFTLNINSDLTLEYIYNGQKRKIRLSPNEMGVTKRGIIHSLSTSTLSNINISTKIPESLADRHNKKEIEFLNNSSKMKPQIILPSSQSEDNLRENKWHISTMGYQYLITTFNCERKHKPIHIYAQSLNSSFLFVTEGEFIVKQNGLESKLAKEKSLIVIDPTEKVIIQASGTARTNSLYTIKY